MLRKCWGYASPICLVWLGMTRYDHVFEMKHSTEDGVTRLDKESMFQLHWQEDGPWWTMMDHDGHDGHDGDWVHSELIDSTLKQFCGHSSSRIRMCGDNLGAARAVCLHRSAQRKNVFGGHEILRHAHKHKSYLAGFSQIKIFQQVYRVIKVSIWWKRMSSQATGKRQTLIAG